MTTLTPRPNSTEMGIPLGYLRAGWPGLIAGGVCFIVPAMLIVLACAWLYVRRGQGPQATWLLYGVKPVIIAVVVQAMWGLLRTAVKGPLLAAVGAGVVALYLAGVHAILVPLRGGAPAGGGGGGGGRPAPRRGAPSSPRPPARRARPRSARCSSCSSRS